MAETNPDPKAALRGMARTRRKAFSASPAAGPAASAITAGVLGLRDDWAGLTVAAYQAMGSEVPLDGLCARLAEAGATIAYPVLQGPAGSVLGFIPVGCRPDMVLVPLVGFDRTGARLGQGGGYYDATLAALRAGVVPPPAIGIAYACQEVEVIPVEPHDQRLDWIVTELGPYRVSDKDI